MGPYEGQKVVLITGCSSGIGLAIAVALAQDDKQRYHVIATMRDLSRSGPLAAAAGALLGRTLTMATLDVCSDASISRCLDDITDRRVDVLINNAGVGLVGPVEGVAMEEMQRVFDTNVFGPIRLIKEVLPDMKRRRAGHIITISSTMGLQGVVFNDVYAASKFAIEGFCESLAIQLLRFNVTVSMIEPGPVHTEFEVKNIHDVRLRDFPGADPETLHLFRDVYLPAALDIFHTLGQTPQHIAMCTKEVVESDSPRFRTLTNPLYTPLVALKLADDTGDLSVRTFYHLLFNLGGLMSCSLKLLRILTCGCLRARDVSPS